MYTLKALNFKILSNLTKLRSIQSSISFCSPISFNFSSLSFNSFSFFSSSSYFSQTYSNFKIPPIDFKPKPYKGPSYEEAVKMRKKYTSPGLNTLFAKPLLIHQGHMQYIWDEEGKRYLDMAAGIVTISIGHCHPKQIKALNEQNITLWHGPSLFLTQPAIEYTAKLASKMPGKLKTVYLTNSGSEANELAVQMARLYTGKYSVLSFQNAYHGNTPTLIGLTALNTWKHNVPTGFGTVHTMVPDVYRGPWGGENCKDSVVQTERKCSCREDYCEANEKYLEEFEKTLNFSFPKAGLAAFIAESIQGAGGTIQFPKGFIKRAFKMVRAKGGLCISDEVQTGFTRTGTHYWGFENHGVLPDMVTMAKGIGNGFPLGAVITTHEIAEPLTSALHFNTFGGDPLACVAGSTTLDLLDEDKCMENSDKVGTYLLKSLCKIRETSKFVGDVRGKGLMVGVEMVQDKKSKKPLDLEKMNSVWNEIKEQGVIMVKGGLYGNVFRIKPPLCISKEDVDFAVSVFDYALNKHLK